VLILEKGTYPGSKSITGGRLYLNQIRSLEPELWKDDDVPLERFVDRERITFMKKDAAVTLELTNQEFSKKPGHSCTLLRSRFDQWLATKAEEKGALIINKTKAEALRRQDGGVVVKAGGDEVGAKIAIVAEGSNHPIATELGMCKAPEPHNFATGVKEVIELPEEKINERFNLEPGMGAAQLFVGDATKGLKGGGFLYTNKDSLSIGIVVGLDAAMEAGIETHRLFDDFKAHSTVASLVRGGRTVEYSAHTIPEGGYHNISRLFDDNILIAGDAAGFALNMGFTVRGMDFAMASGHYAARTAEKALSKGSVSKDALAEYESMLKESFVLKDLQNYRNMNRFLDNPRLYTEYPSRICNAFQDVMRFGTEPKKGLKEFALDEVKDMKITNIIGDIWSALRWL
jgi:electron transfer flavoprotein-quinone oxidoreductase